MRENKVEILEKIHPVLEDFTEWYSRVMHIAVSNLSSDTFDVPNVPKSLEIFLDDVDQQELHEYVQVEKVKDLQSGLKKAAEKLFLTAKDERGLPKKVAFEEFSDNFFNFFSALRRIEWGAMVAETGLDELTGLRNRYVVIRELDRELERLMRQGKQFTVIMCVIDHFDTFKDHFSDDEQREITRVAGEAIRNTIRVYDDGYRISRSEFVICLKHTDMSGGYKFLDRMRDAIDNLDYKINMDGKQIPLSLSYNLGEPMEGDKMDDFLKHMKSELNTQIADSQDTIIEYTDVSPLQQYINQNEDTGAQ